MWQFGFSAEGSLDGEEEEEREEGERRRAETGVVVLSRIGGRGTNRSRAG